MWPSKVYAIQIVDRLIKEGSSISCHHSTYSDAGHGISLPNLPSSGPTYYDLVDKLWYSIGGNRTSNARASADAWNQLVVFFHETLESPRQIDAVN